MDEIILTPELLFEQSEQMTSLMNEYETLFKAVTQACQGMNASWSENLAKNFAGKIDAAQKSFMSISNMFGNGALAAKTVGLTFENGVGLNSIIGSLMGEGGASMLSTGDLTKLMSMLGEGKDTKAIAETIGNLMGGHGADAKTVMEMAEAIGSGDYNKALELGFDKWVDWTAGALANGPVPGSWVDELNEATGGALGLATLDKSFFQNWIGQPIKDAADIVRNEYSGNPDYAYQAHKLGEFAWNFGPGAVLKTGGDAAWDFVKDIPVIGDYYKDQGVTDAEGAFSTVYSDIVYSITGNEEDRQYYRNFYSDHGGVASGIVDGVKDIGSYLWDNGLSSFFKK